MNARRRILIVDDEPNVRLVFRTALESPATTVAAAEDGEAGPGVARGHRRSTWSCSTSRCPRLGGMEVLARLRDAGNDVPVVIVTAHGSIPDAVEAMKLGAIDFLAKPLTPDALRRVVAEVLDRHAARPAGPRRRPGEPGRRLAVRREPPRRPSGPSTAATSTRPRSSSGRPSASTRARPRPTT